MNLIKGLYNRVAGAGQTELVTASGKLYFVRPQGVRSSKECIFIDAVASVRKTSREFMSELVVTRAWAEGEQDLVTEDDETSEERPFLIDEELNFSVTPTAPDDLEDARVPTTSFTWWNIEGDDDEIYLFVCDPDTSKSTLKTFETVMYRCMYERKYQKPANTAAESDLAEFIVINDEPEPPSAPASVQKPKPQAKLFRSPSPESSDSDADELAAGLANLSVDRSAATIPSPKSTGKSREAPIVLEEEEETDSGPSTQESVEMPPDERTLLMSETADLCLYDAATEMFMEQEKATQANLWIVKGLPFPCWLTVAGAGGHHWISTPIDNKMPLTFDEPNLSVIFNFVYESTGRAYTWLLRVSDKATFNRLNMGFARGLFEASNGAGEWSKLKADEQEYARGAYTIEDTDMSSVEEEEDYYSDEEEQQQQQQQASTTESESEESEEEEDSESEESENGNVKPVSKGKNSALAVGYKSGLSFVVRGDMIGVFKTADDGKKLKFSVNINGLSTPDGKRMFEPAKVMLHEQDSAMVLRDPLNPHALYRLDLTTGKVVEEYKISEDIDVDNFLPGSKFAQTTAEQTFIGHSHNAVFRIDPRLSGSKLVGDEYKQYKTKNDFSAAATTESGHLVVASNKGDLRLYDALGKNAKTALPALGDAIIGVDVTKDGRFLIATTKTYLLLIDTTIGDGRYQGSSGFTRSFPAASKPKPKRLTLRPEHAAYMNNNVAFTPAKFNTGPDSEERTIVTSSGPFVIAFNFRRVKAGHLDSYTIKRYDDKVVADSFKFNGDRDIVVTLTNDVFMENKGSLQKPSRQSLGPSNIVKQWGQ